MRHNNRIEWYDSQIFYQQAAALIQQVSTILDIGCGIRPQQFVTPELLICVEPHLEYIEILKKNLEGSNSIIIPLEAKQALAAMPNQSIDSVFLIDVIEHMTKEIGQKVIRECERVARKQVIVFTPLGFMPQEVHADKIDGWNLHGGAWQEHKSGWYLEDFIDWDIIGCKHLHSVDVIGRQISPAYGGFFAIKNIIKSANYFNNIYYKEVLANNISSLDAIKTAFPQFAEETVEREVQRSNMKSSLQACQKTTALLIEQGANKSLKEILELVSIEKDLIQAKEMQEFGNKIRKIATEFNSKNEELREWEKILYDRERFIIECEKSLLIRICRKLKSIFTK